MGLKCSVLGHTYGESTVERDREEQGSEVVITIQETETCTRCGHTRVVSENKEVTAIETPSDIAGDVVEDDEGAEPATDDAGADAPDSHEEPAESTPPTTPTPPGEDDAEIMDDAESGDSGDMELDEPATVPDAEGADADTPDPEDDDAVILDDDSEESDDERDPGEWPDDPATEDDETDWEPESETDSDDDGPDVEPLGGTAVTVPEGQFRCPECGFTRDVESSSLRAGDFCPECRKGALVTEHSE